MATVQTEQETVQPLLSCHDVLRIAHTDAEKVYRNLTGHRITLTYQSDGWHVDYNHTEPFMAGGGPHYIIDPATGTILWKTYEQ